MRAAERWRYAVIDRSVLNNYRTANNIGTLSGGYLQLPMTLHDDGRLVASRLDLTHHLEDWARWQVL